MAEANDGESDLRLVQKSLQGDQLAFAELVERYQRVAYGVALGRTVDPALAEEVAQETFVQAWCNLRKLRAPERIGAFFAGIARQLSKSLVRKRGRQRVIPNDPPPVPTPLDEMLAEEARDLLRTSLERVPRRYREVLVLYYVEGESIERVARVLGLSAQNARQRLSRGRNALRDEVASRLESSLARARPRKGLTAGVIAAIGALPARRVSAASSTLALRVRPPASRWLWSAFGVTLAGLFGTILMLHSCRTETGRVRSNAATSGRGELMRRLSAARRQALSGPTAPRTVCEASGVITRSGGAGLVGATVAMWRTDRGAGTGGAPRIEVTSAEGRFAFEQIEQGTYDISVSEPGFLPKRINGQSFCNNGPVGALSVSLESGGVSLTGTVSDVGGGPIARAVVRVRGRLWYALPTENEAIATLTDEQGGYRITLSPGEYDVAAGGARYAESSREIRLGERPRRLDFQLVPEARISGIVRDRATGRAIAGARVVARGELGDEVGESHVAETTSRADGSFDLSGLKSGSIELDATGASEASREPTIVDLGIAEAISNVDVWVERGLVVSGFVVERGRESSGISAVTLAAVERSDHAGDTRHSSLPSDAGGFFRIAGLEPGDYELALAASTTPLHLERIRFSLRDHDIDDLVAVVDRGVRVAGRIEPPRAGAHIRIEPLQPEIENWTRAMEAGAETGADGKFELDGVEPGEYAVLARTRDGSARIDVTVGNADLRDVVLGVRPGASISGKTTNEDGSALDDAMVWLSRAFTDHGKPGVLRSEFLPRKMQPDVDGAFEFGGLPAGDYELRVLERGRYGLGAQLDWARDPSPGTPLIVHLEANDTKSNVILTVKNATETLSGVVVGDDGSSSPDAWITATLVDAAFQPIPKPCGPVLSDEHGSFRLPGLRRDARYELTAVSARGDARGRSIGIPGAAAVVKLAGVRTLSGVVRDQGREVTAYRISAVGPVQRARNIWSAGGRFDLERLEVGAYEVAVSADAGQARASIVVGSSALEPVAFDLVPWASLRGHLVHAGDHAALGGVRLVCVPRAPDVVPKNTLPFQSETSDALGDFRFPRLPSTTIRLSFVRGSFDVLFAIPPTAASAPAPAVDALTLTLAPGQSLDLGTIELLTLDDVADRARTAKDAEGRP